MIAAVAPTGPPWVQILLSAVGLLGGTGGVVAFATVLSQRRKFRADTAEVLTDTALTLIAPLKTRVIELEAETAEARRLALVASEQIGDLRGVVDEVKTLMRGWRAAILDPNATLTQLRDLMHRD
ncbi:hypothetical protein I0C86_23490 [Plantactinospora sp. S1510]|uniref:Uncharacterized protein n=1 Tax=Plantactinospora alkalitolerans TaxID=2789879 RepID=A0ABS0H164_9ACTN|nr:hypothetical protein [Plantactinospora alkalitolerans]MBF9131904.1 hypothetical protein [Plantactinospora alkalitolerans]